MGTILLVSLLIVILYTGHKVSKVMDELRARLNEKKTFEEED